MTANNYLLYSVLAAALPVLIYVGIIYWVDRYEREPLWLLSAAFIWGAIPGAILAIIFNMMLSLPFYLLFSSSTADFISSGAIAPVVEELTKGLVLFLILFIQRHELDSPLDGIIYGAMVGMGFAMIENILYYVSYFQEYGVAGWNELVVIRGMVFGLNHALYTAMTGLGIALARMSKSWPVRIAAPLLGLAMAMTLHAIHNVAMSGVVVAPLLVGITFGWGGVLVTLLIIILSLYQERRWMRQYLQEEVAKGTITDDDYRIVHSAASRARHRLGLLINEGPRAYYRSGQYYRRCSELAYRKRHHAHFNDEAGLQAIDSLRQSIVDMRAAESSLAA